MICSYFFFIWENHETLDFQFGFFSPSKGAKYVSAPLKPRGWHCSCMEFSLIQMLSTMRNEKEFKLASLRELFQAENYMPRAVLCFKADICCKSRNEGMAIMFRYWLKSQGLIHLIGSPKPITPIGIKKKCTSKSYGHSVRLHITTIDFITVVFK